MKSEYFISLPNDICCSLQTFAAIARGHLNWPYLRNTIGFRRDFPSTAEDLGARNNLNRQTNMATVSKSPLPPMPPRPQSVPLLRKTMSPEPSNVKASPVRSKTPLVRKRSRCQCDFSSQRFHFKQLYTTVCSERALIYPLYFARSGHTTNAITLKRKLLIS